MPEIQVALVQDKDILTAASLLDSKVKMESDELIGAVKAFKGDDSNLLLIARVDGVPGGLLACTARNDPPFLGGRKEGWIRAVVVYNLFRKEPVVAKLLQTAGMWFKNKKGVQVMTADLDKDDAFAAEALKGEGFKSERQLMTKSLE